MSFTDADLIARVLERDDRRAFTELVRRYQSTIRNFLRRLTHQDAALADDLAQETFLRAYHGLQNWRGTAKFSSWLFQIAYHVFASDYEKQKRRRTDSVAEISDENSNTAPAMATDHHDLEQALNMISEAERLAIILTGIYGLTNEEAATVLDCPLGTIKTNIHRGKKRLLEVLQNGAD